MNVFFIFFIYYFRYVLQEPIYIEGMLAVCSHCGISSIDFNRCLRCKRKLPKDVKSISMTMGMQEKKETMLTIDVRIIRL